MRISFLTVIILLITCCTSEQKQLKIDSQNVDFIEIRKYNDTVGFQLNDEQQRQCIAAMEKAPPFSPHKGLVEYRVIFQYKNKQRITYEIRGDKLSAPGGYAYAMGDTDFFKRLWLKQAGLSDRHVEFFPTYKDAEGYYQQRKIMDAQELAAVKQVLTYYGRSWKEVNGFIYYLDSIPESTLYDYTKKAENNNWLKSHPCEMEEKQE